MQQVKMESKRACGNASSSAPFSGRTFQSNRTARSFQWVQNKLAFGISLIICDLLRFTLAL